MTAARRTRGRNLTETLPPETGRVTATPLAGFEIGITADRRADEQIKLLTGRGAACLHGPVIKTHPFGSEEDLRAATQDVIDHPPDLVVATTGVGVRSWLEAAEAIRLADGLRHVLEATTLYARGPKATGALVTAGLEVAWTTPRAQYTEIVAALAAEGVAGRRVAVQLDGAGAVDLCSQLEQLGATIVRVPVYRWSLPDDTGPAERLIRAAVDRRLDAVTFTAKPAVENLLDIAAMIGSLDELVSALATDVAVFCVGPVCAGGFADLPAVRPYVPDRHRLGSMVQQIAHQFDGRGGTVELGGQQVRVQGKLAVVAGQQAWLTDRERALLGALLENQGVVHSKRELLRRVWRGAESDEHLVEVTVARLRKRLGPAGNGIETVMRRGYRASV